MQGSTKGCTLHRVQDSKLSYFLLILFQSKEDVTFTWAAGVQHVLLLTITGDKFVIYVPIGRYGDFNTLQQPIHPSAAPQDVLGYFRVFKSPYLQIGTLNNLQYPGADPGFQVSGGALKKIAPSRERHENVSGILCEKSRFYTKKSYFFQLRKEARKFLGYFV